MPTYAGSRANGNIEEIEQLSSLFYGNMRAWNGIIGGITPPVRQLGWNSLSTLSTVLARD